MIKSSQRGGARTQTSVAWSGWLSARSSGGRRAHAARKSRRLGHARDLSDLRERVALNEQRRAIVEPHGRSCAAGSGGCGTRGTRRKADAHTRAVEQPRRRRHAGEDEDI